MGAGQSASGSAPATGYAGGTWQTDQRPGSDACESPAGGTERPPGEPQRQRGHAGLLSTQPLPRPRAASSSPTPGLCLLHRHPSRASVPTWEQPAPRVCCGLSGHSHPSKCALHPAVSGWAGISYLASQCPGAEIEGPPVWLLLAVKDAGSLPFQAPLPSSSAPDRPNHQAWLFGKPVPGAQL